MVPNWLQIDPTEKKKTRGYEDCTMSLASFCLGRHWVCALVVIPWSSCNGDCGYRARSASGRSSCRSGTQRLCRPRYPMLPSLVCAASSSRVALSVSVEFFDRCRFCCQPPHNSVSSQGFKVGRCNIASPEVAFADVFISESWSTSGS